MSARIGISALLVALVFSWVSERTQAQSNSRGYAGTYLNSLKNRNSASQYSVSSINRQIQNSSVSGAGVSGVNRQNFIGGSSRPPIPASKPFAGINRGPTVSPYLALSNPFYTPTDYYSVIKPQLEQNRINQQLARQQQIQASKLNQVAAQGPYEVTGSEAYAPTGHGTGFMRLGPYLETGSYFAPRTQPKQQPR